MAPEGEKLDSPDSKPQRIWVQELLNIEEEKMNILTFLWRLSRVRVWFERMLGKKRKKGCGDE